MLRKLIKSLAFLCTLTSFNICAAENPLIAIKTDLGTFVIETYPQSAPVTVKNFLSYVDSKFYDGTIFHRIVPGFVVQGGGMTFDFAEKPTQKPIVNESIHGLGNDYKSVAMARQQHPDSATAQFYINLQNNPALNATDSKPGYTVFGKIIVGMDIVENIAKEPRGMFKAYPEAPNYAVRILKAVHITAKELQTIMSEQSSPKPSSIKDALVPMNESAQ
jgi:peptidyl-prolyl cis-trans isomerase A (cyclophilin A)